MGYSKGEWKVFKDMGMGSELFPKGHHQIVGNGQKANVALVPTHWNDAEANAHLIAASPIGHELANAVLSMNPEDFDDFLEIREIAKKFKAKVEEK